jgi:TolB-like 6-blade propeller-like
MNPGRSLVRLFATALVPALCACGAEREDSSRHDASVSQVADDDASHFSGRVPALGGADRPETTLAMHRLLGDSLAFSMVTQLAVADGKLLVGDQFSSPHLGVVELRTGRITARFGRDGEGPGEFRVPSWFVADAGRPGRMWVYDFQNRRLSLVRLDGRPKPVERELPVDAGVSLEAPVWTDGGLIANGVFPDYTLLVMDSAGQPRRRIAADPPFTERQMPHATGRRLMNRSFLAPSPRGDRFALVYQFRNRVDFFRADGTRYGTVRAPRQTELRYRIGSGGFLWEDGNEMTYSSVKATDRYVYALFCGCRLGRERPPSRLHLFRWNGDFVREIALDRAVTAFAVSPDDAAVYGGVEEPYPAIGEWRLPAELRR